MCGGGVRSILLLRLVARCLETAASRPMVRTPERFLVAKGLNLKLLIPKYISSAGC